MKNCLATTELTDFWDLNSRLLLLGPWCSANKKNRNLLEGKEYHEIPSPWRPAAKIKEALDYCFAIYEQLLPQLSEILTSLHNVSFSPKYWRILTGFWLFQFIGVFYERYKRIENALKTSSDFYTFTLPKTLCSLTCWDSYDFRRNSIFEDTYNLKLFSLITRHLCPDQTVERRIEIKPAVYRKKYGWRGKIPNRIYKSLNFISNGTIILSDMYHLNHSDSLLLDIKTGFKTIKFIDISHLDNKLAYHRYHSDDLRNSIKLKDTSDDFLSLLLKVLPEAIPRCYIENYKDYRASIQNFKNLETAKVIGSATGWIFNEGFKFLAAEASERGASLIDFQHGGGYGVSLAEPMEKTSMEKDVFFTWGWKTAKTKQTKPLPSAHLSRLINSHSQKLDKALYVETELPKYFVRFHTGLMPDDMPKYFVDKLSFFQALPDEILPKILYRPYYEYGWGSKKLFKKEFPDVKFVSKNKLTHWMQKVRLVIIDHPHTSFIEALTINVPSVFFWDHEVYLMRPEAEKYFDLLRKAGILYKTPKEAANKVVEIFESPDNWWNSKDVAEARKIFLEEFGYSKKNWREIWIEELKQLDKSQNI